MSGVWTDNWRGVKNVMLTGMVKSGYTTIHSADGGAIADSGDDIIAMSPMRYFALFTPNNSGDFFSGRANAIAFGTGSGTPSANDYNLFTRADSVLNYLSNVQETWFDANDGKEYKNVVVTVQNKSAKPITITEWGIFTKLTRLNTSINPAYPSYQAQYMILLYHDMLDTPVTLQPNQAATFTLTLTLTLNDPL